MQELKLRIANRQERLMRVLGISDRPLSIKQLMRYIKNSGNYMDFHHSLMFLIKNGLVNKIKDKRKAYYVISNRGLETWERRI